MMQSALLSDGKLFLAVCAPFSFECRTDVRGIMVSFMAAERVHHNLWACFKRKGISSNKPSDQFRLCCVR